MLTNERCQSYTDHIILHDIHFINTTFIHSFHQSAKPTVCILQFKYENLVRHTLLLSMVDILYVQGVTHPTDIIYC